MLPDSMGISVAVSTSLMPWAQGSEHPAVRVIKGHGTDSGHGIPQPDAQLIAALGILNSLDRELDRLSVPGGPQGHGSMQHCP